MKTLPLVLAFLAACGGTDTPASTSPTPLVVQPFTASAAGVHVNSTLILGEREAILVDAQFIISDARRLVAEINAAGRRLTTVYVTHAHPDHYFGLAEIRAAFPAVRVLAHPDVAAEMAATWQAKHDQWKPLLGDELTDTRVDAEAYAEDSLALEGHRVELVGPTQGDIAHSVAVWLPETRTLITGDASFSGIHVWMADSAAAGWHAWAASLDELAALGASTVISGHHDPALPHSPADLAATADYLRDFEAARAAAKTPEELIAAMTAKYPSLGLPVVLQISAGAAFAPAAPLK